MARVHWRPVKGPGSSTAVVGMSEALGFSNTQNTDLSHQIASSSLLTDNRIHVWDLNRSHVPFYSIEDHSNVTTAFLWHDADTIWSVSKDKSFAIHHLHSSPSGFRPSDTMPATSVKWNIYGHVTFTNKLKNSQTLSSPVNDRVSTSPWQTKRESGGAVVRAGRIKGSVNDPVMNSVTWSGSSVPSNLGSLLSNQSWASSDDSNAWDRLRSEAPIEEE